MDALPIPSFRPLSRQDFPLLQRWFAAAEVARWWNESSDLRVIEAKYGPRVDGREPTHVFVIEAAGAPVGFIQWYRWADYAEHARQLGAAADSAGIDLAIGEPAYTGRGLGPVIIGEFLRRVVWAQPGVSGVMADPEERNRPSWRAFEKAGFRHVSSVCLTGETSLRRVVQCDRPTDEAWLPPARGSA